MLNGALLWFIAFMLVITFFFASVDGNRLYYIEKRLGVEEGW